METDYQIYYDLEKYIRNDVFNRYHKQHYIEAFDFFCIVIWKSNRAKTRIADNLHKQSKDLNVICKEITEKIFDVQSDKERLRILIEDYKFRLPMSSAILAILYPTKFSIYDFRVCQTLDKYKNLLDSISNFENIWIEYSSYLNDVKKYYPTKTNFVDADRNLWGKSFYEELSKDIADNFKRLKKS